MSLDGYFEGLNRDITWHNVDGEFNAFAVAMLNSVDLLLFGRVTYELMARFWPSPEALRDDPVTAERMNNLPKIVFSRTLERAVWNNTRLMKHHMEEEIMKLKKLPGGNMALLGSGEIMTQLAERGLLDEYWILVNPVALGNGKPMFKGLKERLHLRLLKTRAFRNGNVLLQYQPAGKETGNGKNDTP